MRTSSRELGELTHKGVFVLVGKGRQSRYELKSNRARIAPIAPNTEQGSKPPKIKGEQGLKRKMSPQTTLGTTLKVSPQMSPQNIVDDVAKVESLIRSNDRIKVQEIADTLNVSRRTVLRHIKGLSAVGLHFEGPTKKGRWVFGPEPKGKRGAK
jgi:biotin operon repressor